MHPEIPIPLADWVLSAASLFHRRDPEMTRAAINMLALSPDVLAEEEAFCASEAVPPTLRAAA